MEDMGDGFWHCKSYNADCSITYLKCIKTIKLEGWKVRNAKS